MPAQHQGLRFWILALSGAALVLFVVLAALTAIVKVRAERDAVEKGRRLTDVANLQAIILAEVKSRKHGSAPVLCWYLGAIGYRLAEARDLKIPAEYAIDLTNVEPLVQELAAAGFNTRQVIGGLAMQVYDSPLRPYATFDAQRQACASRNS